MRNTLSSIIALVLVAFTLVGCNEQIPAGHKGKVMGPSGWQPEIYPPSKVWLAEFLETVPEKLFLVETTTQKFNQTIKVVLKDKLTLSADIFFRCRIRGNDTIVNTIFNDMKMNDQTVTTKEVFDVYGAMVVMNTAREVISKYNVDEVNINYARITTELYNAIKPKLEGLPLEISDVTVGNIAYPKMVTDAIENAKKTRMEIEKEEADVQIRLTKARGQEQVSKANYNIKMLDAKMQADYNKKIIEGISPELIRLRELEVQMVIAEALKSNPNVIYMPLPMMGGTNQMRIIK